MNLGTITGETVARDSGRRHCGLRAVRVVKREVFDAGGCLGRGGGPCVFEFVEWCGNCGEVIATHDAWQEAPRGPEGK